jgi:DNA invertase Pin-like site-specific DNA recombinase
VQHTRDIKDIAIYLRKSRNENGHEDVLIKHEVELIEMAKSNRWKYNLYKEIASADSIDSRPIMVQLLSDVQRQLFDAVLVMDLDRLGRGDYLDQARIRKTFSDSKTLIITPQRIYNANDDEEELRWDIEAIFARQEYKMIKKRLLRGKIRGAKNGHWTNGKAPFPYKYNAETKKLEVDEQKIETYYLIKGKFLSGLTTAKIAFELNKLGIPSPGGKLWSENAVYRVITNEVHLGKVLYGKTKGSGHKSKKTTPLIFQPKENWIISEGSHPAIKTFEEHVEIMSILQRRRVIPKMARKGTYLLSGLVYCGKCSYSMQFITQPNGKVFAKKCQHTNPYGVHCDNRGLDAQILLDALYHELSSKEEELLKVNSSTENSSEQLVQLLESKQAEILKLKETINRLTDIYELGDITREEYLLRKNKRQLEISKLSEEVESIQTMISQLSNETNQERLKRIINLREHWDESCEPKEKNRLLKQVVDKIYYTRNGNDVRIDINFL